MTCHAARELFSALLDDALGADERRALDAHLATCADCGRELQRFRGIVALLRSVEPARAPAGFVDRVLDAARPAPWPRRLLQALVLPWPLKLPVEAAAIVLVAVGVVYVFRATPELEQATRPEPTHQSDTTRTDTATSRDVASESSPPDAPREVSRLPEKSQAPKDQLGEKKDATPAAESQTAGKLATPPARSERDRGVAQESERSPAGPAPESRADAQRGQRSALSPAAMPSAHPDVSGRLAVADRNAALRGLAYLIDRLSAVENRRVDGAEGPIIELTVPREAYAELVRELTRLGRWEVSQEAAALPAQVRVVVHITS